ncbi:phospholipase D-like domain-containing protein [Candidatus Cyanaurora vandensis]|uniref:phospholipase D-like domain-containing protein n=1 Tax=Candidatus Cyanaurora vandensis TaxID=2714958 RepID=UPI00257E4B73|nr:phospholipase D-like domain-containing protein [Candidatus Cyanaurora vandensis]
MKQKTTISQRDLVLLGGVLVLILGVGWWLSSGAGPRVDPGTIAVSELDPGQDKSETDLEGYDENVENPAQALPPEELKPIAPLPQHPQIKVYFNQSRAQTYTDPYRKIKRYGDDLEQTIVDQIDQAQRTLDLSVHELNLPAIAQAIVRKHQAGVRVRLIMENSYTQDLGLLTEAQVAGLDANAQGRARELRRYLDINGDKKLTPDELRQRDAIYMFNQAQVPWIDDTEDATKGQGIMHNKYILVDDNLLVTGSTNQTFSDVHGDRTVPISRGNTNNLLVVQSPTLVNLYRQDFVQMWGDGPGGQKDSRFGRKKTFMPAQSVQVGATTVGVQFSPAGARIDPSLTTNGTIVRTLGRATTAVHLALFVFSAQEAADALLALKTTNPSLEISGVFDRNFSYRDFSETLDLWGLSLPGRTCKLETGNRPWSTPLKTITVPVLPEGDKMHHKFVVVDGRIVLTGSHNWSKAANDNNDENTLIIEDPVVAAHYEREYTRLFQRGVQGPSSKLKTKIAEAPKRCPQGENQAAAAPQAAINLNTAAAATLEQLSGISPTTARAIVSYRETNGPFRSLADLDPVQGIGPKTLERLAGQVTF